MTSRTLSESVGVVFSEVDDPFFIPKKREKIPSFLPNTFFQVKITLKLERKRFRLQFKTDPAFQKFVKEKANIPGKPLRGIN